MGPLREGTGSIILIDGAGYQDVDITCTATLDTNCDDAGIVFGYQDTQNYWVLVYSKAQQKILLYEVSSGTWTQRKYKVNSFRDGTPFTMSVEARAGGAYGYDATIPAGQVGLWCSDSSDNEFDDFKVRDLAGPFVADARWFSSTGEVRVDNSDNNVLESYGSLARINTSVRRGCRVGRLGGTGVSPVTDRPQGDD